MDDIQRQNNEVFVSVVDSARVYHILCIFNLILNKLYPWDLYWLVCDHFELFYNWYYSLFKKTIVMSRETMKSESEG